MTFIANLPPLDITASTDTSIVIVPVVDNSTSPGRTKQIKVSDLAILAKGPQGLRGFPGPVGPLGASGPQGVSGPQGPQGTFGPQGPQGPSGVSNVSGPVGPLGPSGPSGPRGPSGVSNVSGPQGPSGPQGIGPSGPSGADSTVSGPIGPSGIRGPSGPRGNQGPQGRIGPQGVQGSQGDPGGPSGPAGPAGPSGPAGADGPSGVSGPQGEPGTPGGPSGPQGEPGSAGPDGPSGPQGSQGPSGASISGPSGPRGASGPSGPQGSGPQGAQGSAGPTGPSGVSGPPGDSISTTTIVTAAGLSITTATGLVAAIENSFLRIRGVPTQDPSPLDVSLRGSNGIIFMASRSSAQTGLRQPVAQDDAIGFISFRGNTNTNATLDPTLTQALIGAYAQETPSASAAGARVIIQTVGVGTQSISTRLYLSDGQNTHNANIHQFNNSTAGTTYATLNSNSLVLGRGFRNSVYSFGNVSGTIAPYANSATVHIMTLTGPITINTMTNVGAGQEATFVLIQDGVGGHTLSSTMLFENGDKTLSTAGNAVDLMRVRYFGGMWYASLSKNYS